MSVLFFLGAVIYQSAKGAPAVTKIMPSWFSSEPLRGLPLERVPLNRGLKALFSGGELHGTTRVPESMLIGNNEGSLVVLFCRCCSQGRVDLKPHRIPNDKCRLFDVSIIAHHHPHLLIDCPPFVEAEEPSPAVLAAKSKVKEAERVLDAAQKELVAAQKRDAMRKVKIRPTA